jgi:hypothetical protein
MGYCAVRSGEGFMNRFHFGRGMGCGRGLGLGRQNRFIGFAATKPMGFGGDTTGWNIENEISVMQQEAEILEAQLKDLRSRIEQVKSAQSAQKDKQEL